MPVGSQWPARNGEAGFRRHEPGPVGSPGHRVPDDGNADSSRLRLLGDGRHADDQTVRLPSVLGLITVAEDLICVELVQPALDVPAQVVLNEARVGLSLPA